MYNKYYDSQAHPHFVPIYSKVPYLDREIFNIEMEGMRESRRTRERTSKAFENIEKVRLKSEMLEERLRNSRLQKQHEENKFLTELKVSDLISLEKEQESLEKFATEKKRSRIDTMRDQKYLDDILLTNSTKAASRLASVRRWD